MLGPDHNCVYNIHFRTPILTSGVSAAHKSFEAAPKDITSEYDPSFIDWHMDIMNQSAEDPALVVQQLVNACTVRYYEFMNI